MPVAAKEPPAATIRIVRARLAAAPVSAKAPASAATRRVARRPAAVPVTAYELDLFGKVKNQGDAATARYLASAEGARAAQIALIAGVASTHLALQADDELLLVQIGSGFKTKGLDRSLKALASLPRELKQRTRLIAIGQDDPTPFLLQVKTLGLSEQVQILKGRSDIPRFLLGADLLIHPAYNENTGKYVLLVQISNACRRSFAFASASHLVTTPGARSAFAFLIERSNVRRERSPWLARSIDNRTCAAHLFGSVVLTFAFASTISTRRAQSSASTAPRSEVGR